MGGHQQADEIGRVCRRQHGQGQAPAGGSGGLGQRQGAVPHGPQHVIQEAHVTDRFAQSLVGPQPGQAAQAADVRQVIARIGQPLRPGRATRHRPAVGDAVQGRHDLLHLPLQAINEQGLGPLRLLLGLALATPQRRRRDGTAHDKNARETQHRQPVEQGALMQLDHVAGRQDAQHADDKEAHGGVGGHLGHSPPAITDRDGEDIARQGRD